MSINSRVTGADRSLVSGQRGLHELRTPLAYLMTAVRVPFSFLMFCLALLMASPQVLAQSEEDLHAANPLMDVMWDYMREQFIRDEPWQYSAGVQIILPEFAEDSTQVPVMVRHQIPDARKLILFADLNPIQHIATYEVDAGSLPDIGLQFRVQQATPVHALIQDGSGLWHVGRNYVDASGGGCTAPKTEAASDDWASNLGQIQGRLFNRSTHRLKVQVSHPMDTGLVEGVPAFWLNEITLTDQDATALGHLNLSSPVSSNPRLTFSFPKAQAPEGLEGYQLHLKDNDGNDFTSPVYPVSGKEVM
ncbi:MAG: quinoprotein dehydrogenase-associated SoxYZ-like carrier [Oceanospirillum sp.]|nr:quinoprotein dehydrogenase-associated SoxYZ-like carrier [Oceanospirillum sp.]